MGVSLTPTQLYQHTKVSTQASWSVLTYHWTTNFVHRISSLWLHIAHTWAPLWNNGSSADIVSSSQLMTNKSNVQKCIRTCPLSTGTYFYHMNWNYYTKLHLTCCKQILLKQHHRNNTKLQTWTHQLTGSFCFLHSSFAKTKSFFKFWHDTNDDLTES